MSTQPTYKTILDLDPAGAKTGNEMIEVVQDGISKQMPLSQVAPAPTPTSGLEAAAAMDGTELIQIEQDGVPKKMPLADVIPDIPTTPELPAAAAKDGTELIEVTQDGVAKKMPLADAITPTTTVADLAAAAAKDGTELVKVRQGGVDKKMTLADVMAFDKYDLKILASTGALAMDKQQVFTIDNTASTAKTLTFTGAPAGRAATFIVVIAGKAGAITWPGTNVLTWNADTPPDLGATRTVVVLLWDGATFTGMQGPTR